MPDGSELAITADLVRALDTVLGPGHISPNAVVVLATCLDAVAKGFGLSESQHIDPDATEVDLLPVEVTPLLDHFLAPGPHASSNAAVADCLYGALIGLAEDMSARRLLNRSNPLSSTALLALGQIYWNIEASPRRPDLPLRPAPATLSTSPADIKVPGTNRDFATMKWVERVNEKGTYKSSGQSFRKQGALLAVLLAKNLIAQTSTSPGWGDVVITDRKRGRHSTKVLAWRRRQQNPRATIESSSTKQSPVSAATSPAEEAPSQPPNLSPTRVVIGGFAEVGTGYQRRTFEDAIESRWDTGGDRRIWLVGGPGLGKSFSARHIMQQAIANRGPNTDDLILWVSGSDTSGVRSTYAAALDRIREHGFAVPGGSDSEILKARAFLNALTTSTWRWLIVIDDVDPAALIESGLVPTGLNPNGRVLITTRTNDSHLHGSGTVIGADLFTTDEAEAYVRRMRRLTPDRPPRLGEYVDEACSLVEAVGRHPLALSIATATITANSMTIKEWTDELAEVPLDVAGDEPDPGGYPHLMGATWRLALSNAAASFPDGVVERAALVAAVQAPSGHPTWLWQDETITDWVSGDAPPTRRRGMPKVVRELIRHGLLELSTPAWDGGTLAIHTLTARAVRESTNIDANDLVERIALAWLHHFTEPGHGLTNRAIRDNLSPLVGMDLPTPVQNIVKAFLVSAKPPSPSGLALRRAIVTELEPYLASSLVGRAHLAEKLVDLGESLEEADQRQAAQAEYAIAATEYERILHDPAVSDGMVFNVQVALADLDERLGAEGGIDRLTRAAQAMERVVATERDDIQRVSCLLRLADCYERLANTSRRDAVRTQASALLSSVPIVTGDNDATRGASAADDLSDAIRHQRVGTLWERLGRDNDAQKALARAAALSPDFYRGLAESRLAQFYLDHGDLDRAMASLRRVVSDAWGSTRDQLLLASALHRQGHHGQAHHELKELAERYEVPLEVGPADLTPRDRRHLAMHCQIELEEMATSGLRAESLEDSIALAHAAVRHLDAHSKAIDDPDRQRASSLSILGLAYLRAARPADAVQPLQEVIAFYREQRDGGESAVYIPILASALADVGHRVGAIAWMTDAVRHAEAAVVLDPTDTSAIASLADSLQLLVNVQTKLGFVDEAIRTTRRLVGLWQEVIDREPTDSISQRRLARALGSLAQRQHEAGALDEAYEPAGRAEQIWQNLAAFVQADDEVDNGLMETRWRRAGILLQRGETESAMHLYNTILTDQERMVAESPGDLSRQYGLAQLLFIMGAAHDRAGDLDTATIHLKRAISIGRFATTLDAGQHASQLLTALRYLADVHRRHGNEHDADAAAAEADDIERRFPGSGD